MFRMTLVPGALAAALLSIGLISSATLTSPRVLAAPKEQPSRASDGAKKTLVEEALHREIYGMQADRERLLEQAARCAPDYEPAQWHRGYVKVGTSWQSVDTIIDQSLLTDIEREYRERREKAKDTATDQLKLANWCRDRKLPGQELAHLSRVLALNPDQTGIRERMGLRSVNGEWLSAADASAAEDRRQNEALAVKRWRTELRAIASGLNQPQAERKEAARQRLLAIRDRHAFPAMETFLSTAGEEAALAVVEAVGRCSGQEATDSLLRHALFSSSKLVREAAAERLASRPRESYVPDLVEEMYLPLTSRFEWAPLANGRLGYRHLIRREGMEQREDLILDTEYSRVARMGGNGRETLQRAFIDSLAGVANREMAVAQRNVAQLALNQRITEALNIATNQQLPADPQAWWKWWDEENDVRRQGDKQTRTRQEIRQVSLSDRRPQFAVGSQSSPSQRRAECFAAGTLVLTRRGYESIEKIQVGDLVLSQHPDTGELAFKPVLETTVRPIGKLVQVTVGRDTLETSRGHLYWLVGQGWSRAKDLRSGDALHSLRGSQLISTVEEGREAQTYNLVVSDFHTYFVGRERILSHDVTNRRPTEAIVPGLLAAE